MRFKIVLLFFAVVFLGVMSQRGEASIFITEILADPAGGTAGDANADGITSSTQDEFFELLNLGLDPVDLSSWSMKDAVSTRHVFPANTLLDPYNFLVVFGGGSPNLPGVDYQTASTGGLSLNNSGDTVSIFDNSGFLMDQVIYGTLADHDQSLAKFPEGSASGFVLHSSLPEAQGRVFSPGKTVGGQSTYAGQLPPVAAVPELPAAVLFGMGSVLMGIKRKLRAA